MKHFVFVWIAVLVTFGSMYADWVTATIPVGVEPHGIAINPVGWMPDLRFIGVFLLVVISLAGYWVLRQSRKLVQAREIDWMILAGSSISPQNISLALEVTLPPR